MVNDVGLCVGGCCGLEVEFGEINEWRGDGDDVVKIESALADHGEELKAGEVGECGE